MTISMYQASIPVFTRSLTNLIAILGKAAAYAEVKKIDPSVLINYRLAPDMFALTRQVQIATDIAKGCAARLSGQEPPKFEDKEASLDDLVARLRKTIDYLNSFKPAQIDGSEDKVISLTVGGTPMQFDGLSYLLKFAQPNVYFHVTTAYAILRHCGVDIGKYDFLGKE